MNYNNTNTGALFSNKKTKDTQPDYKGKINFNGMDYELAGWIKTSENAGKYLQLKVSEPFKKDEPQIKTTTGIHF